MDPLVETLWSSARRQRASALTLKAALALLGRARPGPPPDEHWLLSRVQAHPERFLVLEVETAQGLVRRRGSLNLSTQRSTGPGIPGRLRVAETAPARTEATAEIWIVARDGCVPEAQPPQRSRALFLVRETMVALAQAVDDGSRAAISRWRQTVEEELRLGSIPGSPR